MTYAPITAAQQKRLQTVYTQLARHTMQESTREARLAWASEALGRSVTSFSSLDSHEAKQLIDSAQHQLGVKAPAKHRMDAYAARQAGTEGRKGASAANITIAGAADLERIRRVLSVLGWSEDSMRRWLESPKGPLGRRTEIRTVGDANRVYWGLKRIAIAKGVWQDRRSA
jgi:hypothetical protein